LFFKIEPDDSGLTRPRLRHRAAGFHLRHPPAKATGLLCLRGPFSMTPIPSQGLCPLRIHCVGFDPTMPSGKWSSILFP